MSAALITGCAATPAPPPPRIDPAPPLPGLSKFQVNAQIECHLGSQFSALTGLPATLTATPEVTAHAEAVSASPPRSHREGTSTLEDSGTSAGSPHEAVDAMIGHFIDAMAPTNPKATPKIVPTR